MSFSLSEFQFLFAFLCSFAFFVANYFLGKLSALAQAFFDFFKNEDILDSRQDRSFKELFATVPERWPIPEGQHKDQDNGPNPGNQK